MEAVKAAAAAKMLFRLDRTAPHPNLNFLVHKFLLY
jgi:hypothetical protein